VACLNPIYLVVCPFGKSLEALDAGIEFVLFLESETSLPVCVFADEAVWEDC
jgi:hypothetical protein